MKNDTLPLGDRLTAAWKAMNRPVDIYMAQQFALHLDHMLKGVNTHIYNGFPIVDVTTMKNGSPLVITITDPSEMLHLSKNNPTFCRLEIGAIPDSKGRHEVKTTAERVIPQGQQDYLDNTLYADKIDRNPRQYPQTTQSLSPLDTVNYIESKVGEMLNTSLNAAHFHEIIQLAKDIPHCGTWHQRFVQGFNHPGPQILL